ncbi:Fatty acyl-CoA synthetase B [Eumeta japonica]|uniref:Fatty acyl-CoA synthetase B n=1 Tax=Eumeta variegata TaxID=151549 RepID=A0A4C2AFG0_EUMVA|nr:Fatty acyl-CoA synthetase B [Eumeta japonica]
MVSLVYAGPAGGPPRARRCSAPGELWIRVRKSVGGAKWDIRVRPVTAYRSRRTRAQVSRPTAGSQGYYRDAENTREAFTADWFKTGDIVRRDDAGHYYYVDRIKNMFNVVVDCLTYHDECLDPHAPFDLQLSKFQYFLFERIYFLIGPIFSKSFSIMKSWRPTPLVDVGDIRFARPLLITCRQNFVCRGLQAQAVGGRRRRRPTPPTVYIADRDRERDKEVGVLDVAVTAARRRYMARPLAVVVVRGQRRRYRARHRAAASKVTLLLDVRRPCKGCTQSRAQNGRINEC